MMRNRKKAIPVLAAALVLGPLLASCGDEDDRDEKGSKSSSSSPKPHGYVEGAEEAAEQQSRLVLRDGESGRIHLLDLVEEKDRKLGRVADASSLTTDGRFAYAHTRDGSEAFDSGAWMVDHGDHVHYYRADPRSLGGLPGKNAQHVYSSSSITALTYSDGTARLLDHARMEKGGYRTTAVLKDVGEGPVVPYEGHAFVPVSGNGGNTVIEARDAKGRGKASLEEKCPDVRGAAVTRRGVVFGCADGALFVRGGKSGKFEADKIPFGRDVPKEERPENFEHRSLGTTLTAKAGDKGVWLLDVTGRRWKLVETGPVVAVNTAGEGTPLLTLDGSGTMRSYDASTGKKIASKKVLRGPVKKGSRPVIEVDANRAYVNDAAGKKIHEIDYNDDLRTARSFPLDFAPADMVETGR